MEITIATLIYRSPKYLDFVMNSMLEHPSKNHDVNYLIVCNDATEEVIKSAQWWAQQPNISFVVHDNPDPEDWWIQNVYNAWNRCVEECETDNICFVNSDMAFSDGWLDNLAKYDLNKYIPTSRLVESGRMPSLRGLISQNFGRKLNTFRRDRFETFARDVSEPKKSIGLGAYMPSLFRKEIFTRIGGWHKNIHNIPGDKITFELIKRRFNVRQIMVHDSIVYHFQRGESFETNDLR